MFITNKSTPDPLDAAIADLFEEMKVVTSDDDEYIAAVTQLTELYKLRELTKPKSISPDVVLTVAGNLVGILAILHFERVNVITSKALGFVLKLR